MIKKGEIHLWFVEDEDIRDSELIKSYHCLLSREEADRQRRFYFEKNRHQYLVTRALVRTALSYYTENIIKPTEWVFVNNRYGKPSIANHGYKSSLSFNLSHSDNMIVLAVTNGQEVGVDVECLSGGREAMEVIDGFFSAREVAQLRAIPERVQSDRFFDLWTLKEAYIKARGMGLSIPLDHFSFEFTPAGGITISFTSELDDQPKDWQFWQIQPSSTHRAAVGIKSSLSEPFYELHMRNAIPMMQMQAVDFPIFRKSANLVSQ